MILKIKYLLIILVFYNYSYSQNLVIENPTFETPENEFYSIYEEDKIDNPIYLNGTIKTVERQYKQHKSIYRHSVKHTQIYKYKLNTIHKIIDFETNNEYDDSTIETLNIKSKFTTKKDTIINNEGIEYTFKKGLLILKKVNKFKQQGSIDSIVYNYNNLNKLVEIKHFNSYGEYETDENGNLNDDKMVFDEYELKVFEKATYNDSNKLIEKDKYIINYDIIEHYKTSFLYTNLNLLQTDNKVYKEYHRDSKNEQDDNPIIWSLKEIDLLNYNPLSWKTTYEYDNNNRIIKYIKTFIEDYEKKEQFVWQKEKGTITYNDDLRTRTINTVTTKKTSSFAEPRTRKLYYEYYFDSLNNPIKILTYIVKDNEKILDKSTVLNITYF